MAIFERDVSPRKRGGERKNPCVDRRFAPSRVACAPQPYRRTDQAAFFRVKRDVSTATQSHLIKAVASGA